ncbi:hypothetical protein BS78_02G370100 [Paspalum vaginatum]|nr:hypothetical protein BS78_02G370100 [Paspalum vaginatum]
MDMHGWRRGPFNSGWAIGVGVTAAGPLFGAGGLSFCSGRSGGGAATARRSGLIRLGASAWLVVEWMSLWSGLKIAVVDAFGSKAATICLHCSWSPGRCSSFFSVV